MTISPVSKIVAPYRTNRPIELHSPPMEVRMFSNSSRPGIGWKPRREGQRPLLPQHARHCPVLEAGSALGFMVYPALEPNETFHIEFQGEGRYQFVYCLSAGGGKWDAVFSVVLTLPAGGIG